MTIQIRRLAPGNLNAAEILLTESYGRQDEWRTELERYLTIQPDGWFAAVRNDAIVGVGGALNYGPFGTVGLMATHPSAQRQGIATTVLDQVVSWLRAQGCPIAVLDASAAGAPVYERYGFLDIGTTLVFRRDDRRGSSASLGEVTRLQSCEVTDIAGFDAPLFGANRACVLHAIFTVYPNRAFMIRDQSGSINGYLFAQANRIGPWVAATEEDAAALLATALTLSFDGPVTALVPSSNLSAAGLLEARGFVRQRALRHMYLGPSAPAQDRTRIYGLTSFAIG